MLDEQRRTIIVEYCDKVFYHDLSLEPNKIAEFYKKNYCDNNKIFVKFIEEQPNIRDASWKRFAHPQTTLSAPCPQELNSTWKKNH